MSKKTVSQVDSNELIKIHQANYAVFQAQTEKEINQAIQNALQSCQYVTAYYAVNDSGLERVFTYKPSTKKSIKAAPEQLEMTPAEVAQYFSQEVHIRSRHTRNAQIGIHRGRM
jgi:uncharacterized protein YqhQ